VFTRFQPAPAGTGETLPGLIARLTALGVSATALYQRLSLLGYSPSHDENYRARCFTVTERRVYDAGLPDFPKIIRRSFVGGDLPPGTLRVSYAVDLTGEPPNALKESDVDRLLLTLAQSA
jgi:hypothetical protein